MHFISKFVASEWFIRGDEERRRYLQLLGSFISRSDWRCFSFAIMSNHIHLALLAGTSTLASWLRPAHSEFAEWINSSRERIGAVFVRGPRMRRVDDHAIARVVGYIHRNPVRAGVVGHPRESAWTSHQAYVGVAPSPAWLDIGLGLERAGFDDPSEFDQWIDCKSLDVKPKPPKRGRPAASR